VLGVVHQGVVRRRQRQARDGRQHEDGESNEIGASDPRVSASKVLLDIPLAEQEENGWDEVGIDVDRLIVDIRPTAERSVNRVRDGPIAMENPLVRFTLEPFRHLIEREKNWASCLAGHFPPFVRL